MDAHAFLPPTLEVLEDELQMQGIWEGYPDVGIPSA